MAIHDIICNNTTIHTTVTASAAVADDWLSDVIGFFESNMDSSNIVGLDVEWRPSFSKYQNPLALIQLCHDDHCLIFQFLHCDSLPSLLPSFLADNRFNFVGVGIREDVKRLGEELDLWVGTVTELRSLAADVMQNPELKQKGLAGLAKEVLGLQVEKPRHVQMGRWDNFHLNFEQIKYACIDAYLSSEIGRNLFADDGNSSTVVHDIFCNGTRIPTTVTASAGEADAWLDEALSYYNDDDNNIVVGLDVKWRPSFSRNRNPLALIQLCIDDHCLIFQLLHCDGLPSLLTSFLDDSRFNFVGVGIHGDANRLGEELGLWANIAYELGPLAADIMQRPELKQKGLAALAREVMGVQVDKPRHVRLGRWDNVELDGEQIEYACLDAYLAFEIGRRLYAGEF